MKVFKRSNFIFVIWLLKEVDCRMSVLQDGDSMTNEVVQVQFDQVVDSDWTTGVLMEFRNIVANLTGIFCRQNLSDCKMAHFNPFKASDVIIVSGRPKFIDVNSIMRFFVNLPQATAISVNNTMVPQDTLAAVVKRNRIRIQSHLLIAADEEYEASFRISFVNNDPVLPTSDQFLNTVITPIAVAVVIVLLVIVLGLEIKKNYSRKMKLREVQQSKRKEKLLAGASAITVGIRPNAPTSSYMTPV